MHTAEMEAAARGIVAEAEAMAALASGTRYEGYTRDIAEAGRHLIAVIAGAAPGEALPTASTRVELTDLAERACAMVALRAADKRIDLRPPPGGPVLAAGDERAALQILVNLLTNAVKFTPEGGRVAVAVSSTDGVATVDVLDDGPGVGPDFVERMFADFERAPASDGLGLGLAISRELAQAMHGELVHVPTAAGACFRLTLPAG